MKQKGCYNKTSTNYGEDYNRESMYETAREILLTGKKVKMNHKKHISLIDIMIEDAVLEEKKRKKLKAKADKLDKKKNKGLETLQNFHFATDYLDKASRIKDRTKKSILEYQQSDEEAGELLASINGQLFLIAEGALSLEEMTRCFEVISQVEQFYHDAMYGDCVDNKSAKLYDRVKSLRVYIEGKMHLAQENEELNK